MQLPRGRFHRLIKSTTSRVLIEEMASARFTGICTIVPGEKSAVLVLNEGLVVLAEYGGIRGQHALDAVSNDESEAAAELNLLTPEQVQLAREFNQPYAIDAGDAGREKRTSPTKPAPGGGRPLAGVAEPTAACSPEHRAEPTGEGHRIPMPGTRPVQEMVAATPSGNDEIDMLIQNMEKMDVEQLISNFRINCKEMLRNIHLDHLIQDGDI